MPARTIIGHPLMSAHGKPSGLTIRHRITGGSEKADMRIVIGLPERHAGRRRSRQEIGDEPGHGAKARHREHDLQARVLREKSLEPLKIRFPRRPGHLDPAQIGQRHAVPVSAGQPEKVRRQKRHDTDRGLPEPGRQICRRKGAAH